MRCLIGQYFKGQRVKRIPRKNRGCLIKCIMHRGLAPPHIIIIHARHIVMDQRIDMNAFNRGAHPQRRLSADVEQRGRCKHQQGPQALSAAREAAPDLPRGLLLDAWRDGWLDEALGLGCRAVVCNYGLWDADSVQRTHAAGLRCLSYTVNDAWACEHLLALGTDGIITDRVDLFAPD